MKPLVRYFSVLLIAALLFGRMQRRPAGSRQYLQDRRNHFSDRSGGEAFGQAHKNGSRWRLNDLNAKGGVMGKKIELGLLRRPKPSRSGGAGGRSKLIDQDHVPIILGAYSSVEYARHCAAVTQKQVPLLMPTATADNVIETGSPWAFRHLRRIGSLCNDPPSDFLKAMNAPKNVAIVYENTNFGQANGQAMDRSGQGQWFRCGRYRGLPGQSPDYKSLLQRVKAKNPGSRFISLPTCWTPAR